MNKHDFKRAAEIVRGRHLDKDETAQTFIRAYVALFQGEPGFNEVRFLEDCVAVAADAFKVGHLVELHPGTDRWMMGDGHGVVVSVIREKNQVRVKLNRSGATFTLDPKDILGKDRL